jgi:hypothetical protein
MNTSADVLCFLIQNITIVVLKCLILLKPVLGGVECSLHLPVLSMSMLNQTDYATFFQCCFWHVLFRDSVFLYFSLMLNRYCSGDTTILIRW